VGATERLVLSPTCLLLDMLGAGHVEHPWVRTLVTFGTKKNLLSKARAKFG